MIAVPAQRPLFLKALASDAAALSTAFGSIAVKETFPGAVTARDAGGGAVAVTLTGMSPSPLDGIVDFGASAGSSDSKHFTGLARGEVKTITLQSSSRHQKDVDAPATVRVRVGDQRIITSVFPVSK